ncbi:hypothetical protein FCN82_12010 [Klebsiella variicola]|nr:hypothetical protein FCN82_12010 [Klebsiella variicola]
MDLTPHITKPHSLNNDFLWGLRGALFTRNTNNTNNKQHVNRGYDSESATYSENPAYGWCLLFCALYLWVSTTPYPLCH